MRFSFSPGNITHFKSYFKHSIEFLDFFVTDTTLYVVSNTTEMYSHLSFDILSKEDIVKGTCFRVPRKKFLSLLCEGVVSFFIGGTGYVEITFKPNVGPSYNIKMEHQNSDTMSISTKMGILAEFSKFKILNLRKIDSAVKMIKETVKIISVVNGMVVAATDNVRVFYKTDCENFNLYATTVQHLLNNSDQIYRYQNFVIGRGQSSIIIARQVRTNAESEQDVLGNNYTLSLELGIPSVCYLADRCGDADTVILNLEKSVAVINEGKTSYTTSFTVNNVKSIDQKDEPKDFLDFDFDKFSEASLAPVHKLPTIALPLRVVRDILSSVATEKIILKIKKHFIQFQVRKDIFVVVRRAEVDAGI